MRKTNENGKAIIKSFESLKLDTYYATEYERSIGLVSIGWGTTRIQGKPIRWGLKITKEQADRFFEDDLQQFEKDVEGLVKVPITSNQFSALVSFAYNVGSDIDADDIAEGLGDSTLLKLLNQGDYQGAADQFLVWNKQKGKVLSGLTTRRALERQLFLTPDGEVFSG